MIIRQTESLENIVEEFSKFARMPKINKVRSNFSEILDSKPSIELTTMLNEATPRDKLRIVIKFVKRKTKLLFFEVNNLFIKKSISFI